MLNAGTEARCDSPGCGEALLFRYEWVGPDRVVIELKCPRCKQLIRKDLIRQ